MLYADSIIGLFDNVFIGTSSQMNFTALQQVVVEEFGVDVLRLTVTTVVPIPAAAWLFGSALLSMGWLRCRKSH